METLSIVIPAYNEEQRLPATLDRIGAYVERSPIPVAEILVVDDGSRDGTAALVEARQGMIRLVSNPGNRGKGYAVRNGMLAAQGDWILSTDADLSAPIDELAKLIAAARRENAVVAIGSRALDRKLVKVHQPLMRELSGRAFNMVMRLVTGLPFRDTQCGFKLFRSDAAKDIFSRQVEEGFSFDVEDLVIARALGLRSIEVPVEWSNVEGTKVSLTQGMKSFADLVRIRSRAIRGNYK
ncbi:MAG TPA: dolichyl-phosphate beta-glucosyltransferase [Bryobacteraceae bacterium]|nr:dolichyl-phosphate beta-glucosyltransferase [Bryobacteraceae bacterium]